MRLLVPQSTVIEAMALYPDHAGLKGEYPELKDEDIDRAASSAAPYIDDEVARLVAALTRPWLNQAYSRGATTLLREGEDRVCDIDLGSLPILSQRSPVLDCVKTIRSRAIIRRRGMLRV